MDVQTPERLRPLATRIGLALILLLALVLRLKGVHAPLLDHPGWRQGDTASIARNFATLQFDPLYPQTNYNGPPPNYVELELQIVPFLAAMLYKVFGVHEIFGRLITIAFSVGTVAVLAVFGRWLFASATAGLLCALLYAIMPGSIYYGRTFTPDTTMVFFLTAALYAITRYCVEDERLTWRGVVVPTILLALAFLAKPVAVTALVPIGAIFLARVRAARTLHVGPPLVLVVVPLVLLALYDRAVSSHAEWHWASGITRLHVMPSLRAAFSNGAEFAAKFAQFRAALGMLATTMAGPACFALAILGFAFGLRRARAPWLLWGWLIGGLAYAYVVVTVEGVDYYLYLLLPPMALAGAGFLLRITDSIARASLGTAARVAIAAAGVVALVGVVAQNRAIVKPYYAYKKQVYRDASALNATLAPDALIVMGHYDPSVLYYIGRYGWEEDPYLWTTFDEQSAIRKGARYFVDIEHNRFAKNVELCAWMQRFPMIDARASWPVYRTDPAFQKPNAEAEWQSFRRAERAGNARAWLNEHHVCAPTVVKKPLRKG